MHSADCGVTTCPFVHLSVRPSVTRRYCIDTAKHTIKLIVGAVVCVGAVV